MAGLLGPQSLGQPRVRVPGHGPGTRAMVPGHGPGTRAKCCALSATKSTQAEERQLDQPAYSAVAATGQVLR
jgi:hypothetical protein